MPAESAFFQIVVDAELMKEPGLPDCSQCSGLLHHLEMI
jgi:hypothetical protein